VEGTSTSEGTVAKVRHSLCGRQSRLRGNRGQGTGREAANALTFTRVSLVAQRSKLSTRAQFGASSLSKAKGAGSGASRGGKSGFLKTVIGAGPVFREFERG